MIDIISDQRRNTTTGGCVVHLSWTLPSNVGRNDLGHILVFFNGTLIIIGRETFTDTSLAMKTYTVCSCGAHNISIIAINCCGMLGEAKHHILEDPDPLPNNIMVCAAADSDSNIMNNADCGNYGEQVYVISYTFNLL